MQPSEDFSYAYSNLAQGGRVKFVLKMGILIMKRDLDYEAIL
jgi:hypothetical protein